MFQMHLSQAADVSRTSSGRMQTLYCTLELSCTIRISGKQTGLVQDRVKVKIDNKMLQCNHLVLMEQYLKLFMLGFFKDHDLNRSNFYVRMYICEYLCILTAHMVLSIHPPT